MFGSFIRASYRTCPAGSWAIRALTFSFPASSTTAPYRRSHDPPPVLATATRENRLSSRGPAPARTVVSGNAPSAKGSLARSPLKVDGSASMAAAWWTPEAAAARAWAAVPSRAAARRSAPITSTNWYAASDSTTTTTRTATRA